MRERPILFSAPMVRAILAGQKTQTRRAVKWRGVDAGLNLQFSGLRAIRDRAGLWALESDTRTSRETRCDLTPCPYGQPGDRLWVREAFAEEYDYCDHPEMPGAPTEHFHFGWHYRADGQPNRDDLEGFLSAWKPSIHMPRAVSRITLEITGVRVERLHAISEADSRAEGAVQHPDGPWHAFRSLWTLVNGAESWDANPWVWVVEFKRLEA